MKTSRVSRPGPGLFALFASCEDQKGNRGLGLDTQNGGDVSFLASSPAYCSTLPGPMAHPGFPGHLPDGQERVKGMVWASYKFPISVGRAGLLAGRGLGWGEGELGKSQEVVSR